MDWWFLSFVMSLREYRIPICITENLFDCLLILDCRVRPDLWLTSVMRYCLIFGSFFLLESIEYVAFSLFFVIIMRGLYACRPTQRQKLAVLSRFSTIDGIIRTKRLLFWSRGTQSEQYDWFAEFSAAGKLN